MLINECYPKTVALMRRAVVSFVFFFTATLLIDFYLFHSAQKLDENFVLHHVIQSVFYVIIYEAISPILSRRLAPSQQPGESLSN